MDSDLKSDEIELLRSLLIALTKIVDSNDKEAQMNNSLDTSFLPEEGLVFAQPDESDLDILVDGYSIERKPKANEEGKTVEMRAKHETFLRVCDELKYELGLIISSFFHVGGTRSVVQAALRTRTLVEDVRSNSTEWIPLQTYRMKAQGTMMYRTLRALAEASLQLGKCLSDFGNYHGLPLQEFSEWEWSLRDGSRSISRFLKENDHEGLSIYVFQSLMPELSRCMGCITPRLKALIPLTLPPIQSAENNATTRYLNMTTIATFFSGVTATTLQISFAQSGSSLSSSVNLLWLLSLVFSVSSAINSLLGMTWRKSSIAPPAFRLPRWAAVWLDIAPMIFLFISAFAFAVGLVLFSFASQQSMFVSAVITTFIALHIIGLFILSLWFLAELEKDSTAVVRRLLRRSVYEPIGALYSVNRQKCSSAVQGLGKSASHCLNSLKAIERRFRWRLPQADVDLEADAEQEAVADKITEEETASLSSMQKIEAREPQAYTTANESEARSQTGSALNDPAGFTQHRGLWFINYKHKHENQVLKSSGGHF